MLYAYIKILQCDRRSWKNDNFFLRVKCIVSVKNTLIEESEVEN